MMLLATPIRSLDSPPFQETPGSLAVIIVALQRHRRAPALRAMWRCRCLHRNFQFLSRRRYGNAGLYRKSLLIRSGFNGKKTASAEPLTNRNNAAHRTLPFGSRVE